MAIPGGRLHGDLQSIAPAATIRRLLLFKFRKKETVMRSINLAIATATLAASVAACTTTDDSYYQPRYGYSQGYAYPADSGYYSSRSRYYAYPPPR